MSNIIEFKQSQIEKRKREKSEAMCSILQTIKNKTPIELLETYDIPLVPPIDINTLLDRIGISIVERDFTDVEEELGVKRGVILGAALSNGNNLAIFLKIGDSLHRKKFTMAHELAHCCKDCPDETSNYIEFRRDLSIDISKYDENYNEEKEKKANIFAGELLIPQKILQRYYDNMVIPSLTKLAKIFDVSVAVMEARLDYLQWPYFKDMFPEDKEPILYEG